MGLNEYISGHFATSVYTSGIKDTREVDLPSGYRLGINYRYFIKDKLFKMKFWGDIEYRRAFLTGKNIHNNIQITKEEFSFRIGVHF